MMSSPESCTEFFPSYEAREDAFRAAVNFKLARRYGGPAQFWDDFRAITSRVSAAPETGRIASITSNPRDCLAFASAEQVLSAAFMSCDKPFDTSLITEIASHYGLAEVLTQPVRTLSGGEAVKLALAKTSVSLASSSKVVISSPFTWLSPANRYLLEEVIELGRRQDREISILALDGEHDLSAAADGPTGWSRIDVLPFSLRMSGVRIPLTLSLNPLDDAVPLAAVTDTDMNLESPCLITGENGQGKSLIARAAAGSLALRGNVSITRERAAESAETRAGLLFQDVQAQTLMRSFADLAAGKRGADRDAAVSVYNRLRDEYNASLNRAESSRWLQINEFDRREHSLLDVKAVLTAARLAAAPAALILDEPDWGLSRSSSIAFVASVIAVAHRMGIPVLLISHKPWWLPLVRSCLAVTRTASKAPGSEQDPVFTVSLQHGGQPC